MQPDTLAFGGKFAFFANFVTKAADLSFNPFRVVERVGAEIPPVSPVAIHIEALQASYSSRYPALAKRISGGISQG